LDGKAVRIDEMLSMLESVYNGLRREIGKEEEIKHLLEGHKLTETIFPIQIFKEIRIILTKKCQDYLVL
jgi:hypothetical protein